MWYGTRARDAHSATAKLVFINWREVQSSYSKEIIFVNITICVFTFTIIKKVYVRDITALSVIMKVPSYILFFPRGNRQRVGQEISFSFESPSFLPRQYRYMGKKKS